MNTEIGRRTCRNCSESFRDAEGRFCRLNPPSSQAVVAMDKGRPVILGQVTVFPKVEDDWRCGQHKSLAVFAERDMLKGRAPALAGVI